MNPPLYEHQKTAIARGISMASHAIFHDPGLGKTRTCLEIYADHKKRNPALKLLVICPISLINSAWGEDIAKFTTFKYVPYKEASKHNIDFDITALNFESLISVNYFERVKQMVKNSHYMAVIDESSRIKSYKSITTKKILELASYFDYKYVCSGTPCPNGEIELWAQISFICDILPKSFFAFRNIYFSLQRGGKEIQGQIVSRLAMRDMMMKGWKYSIRPSMREEFYRKIARYCHWVKKADALDLPETITQIREIQLNADELKAYKEMKNNLITEIRGKEIVAQVALSKLMKLRQCVSGFFYDENSKVHEFGNSKLNELKNILDELGNQSVIIWCQFIPEIEKIKEYLGDKATTMYSDTDNKDDSIEKFKRGEVQYIVAHPRSMSYGHTLTVCSTMVFFSIDYSEEMRVQSEGRTHRISQTKTCLYIYMLGKDTIDHQIYKVLDGKATMTEAVYEMLK